MIEALVFDFGRVISAQKPIDLFASYERDLDLMPGTINTIMFESPFWHRALVGKLDWPGYWQTIAPQLNLTTPEEISSFAHRYFHDERVNQGVVELIERCFGNYRLAILSNHPPGLGNWLSDWGIDYYFDTVFCSGDEGVAKPDPNAFHTILKRLNTLPQKTIFIDDTPSHVAAAKTLGFHGIIFSDISTLEKELTGLIR